SFFLVGDVDHNRDCRLSVALAVAQWRRAHADPQKRAVFTTITLFELIRLGFSDDSAKKAPAFGDVAGMGDLKNGFAEDFTLLIAKHRTEFLVRERDAARQISARDSGGALMDNPAKAFLCFAPRRFRVVARGDVIEAINRSDYFSLLAFQRRRADKNISAGAARLLD